MAAPYKVQPVPVHLQAAASAPATSAHMPSKIREGALRMLASLGEAVVRRPSPGLASALRNVAGKIEAEEPMSMLQDLAADVLPPSQSIPAAELTVTASSTKSKSFAASEAIGPGHWRSGPLEASSSSRVLVTIAKPTHVSAIRFGFESKHMPATFEIFAEDSATGGVVQIVGPTPAQSEQPQTVALGTGVLTSRVMVRLAGFPKGKKGKGKLSHSLSSLALGRFSQPLAAPSGQLRGVLASVVAMLAGASASADADVRDAGLLSLSRVAVSSGSALAVISLLRVLSAWTGPLPHVALQAARDVVRRLRQSTMAACTRIHGAGGGADGWATVPAKFKNIHRYAKVVRGGAGLRSESSDTWGQVDVAMSSGVHQWEMTLKEDSSGGECSCFGVSIEKPEEQSYEYQSCFVLARCFNGRIYNFGSTEGTIEKVHPNDKIRMELDMDKGVLRFWVNGKAQKDTVTGLRKHKTLYPVVQFYSSGREVALNWFKSKGGGSAGGATGPARLAQTEPQKRPKDALPLGLWDRTGDLSAPLSLNGGEVVPARGIAVTLKGAGNAAGGDPVEAELLPEGGAATQVTWKVADASPDVFRCTVGLCDPAPFASSGDAGAAAAASASSAAGSAPGSAAEALGAAESKTADGPDAESESKADAPADGAAASASGSAGFGGPNVTLQVLADGKLVFSSRPFPAAASPAALPYGHPSLAPQRCSVRVSGCKTLTLVVKADGPVPEGVHAVFADAELATGQWLERVERRVAAAADAERAAGGDPLLGATRGVEAAACLAEALDPIADEALGARAGRLVRSNHLVPAPPLALPFVAQPSAETVGAAVSLIDELRPVVTGTDEAAAAPATRVLSRALGLVKLQLRCLVHGGVHPSAVGFADSPLPNASVGKASDLDLTASPEAEGEASGGADSSAAAAASAAGSGEATPGTDASPAGEDGAPAESGLARLRSAVASMSDDAALPAEIRAAAAAVIDDNISLFYPTPALCRDLVSGLTRGGRGGAVEVQFRWPVPVKGDAAKRGLLTPGIGATDARFERAALLLHAAAEKLGMESTVVSLWRRAVHVVLSPSPAGSAAGEGGGPVLELLLGGGLAGVLASAGITGWSFPRGIPSEGVACGVERLASINRRERAATEPGAVMVRLFPAAVVDSEGVEGVVRGIKRFHETSAQDAEMEEAEARKAAAAAPAGEAAEGDKDSDAASTSGSDSDGSGSSTDSSDEEEEEELSDEEEEDSDDF